MPLVHHAKRAVKWARRVVADGVVRWAARRGAHSLAKTLVVAPHPDDEVFGCGGLAALACSQGAEVWVVFLTRGEGSHRGCCSIAPGEIAKARQALAVKAAASLGVPATNLRWLGLEDGRIPQGATEDGHELTRMVTNRAAGLEPGEAGPNAGSASCQSVPVRGDLSPFEEAVTSVSRVIAEVAPQEVFCPHPLDTWPDHKAAAAITLEALRQWGQPCKVHFYLVWGWYNMPLRYLPRLGVRRAWRLDISPVLERKRAAIQSYLGARAPGCGIPYIGKLPPGFVEPFLRPYEVFFEHDGRPWF